MNKIEVKPLVTFYAKLLPSVPHDNKHRTVRAIIGMNFQSAYSCCILNIGSIRVCTENKSYRLNILISKVETEMHFVNKYEGIKPSMINSWKRILKESFP